MSKLFKQFSFIGTIAFVLYVMPVNAQDIIKIQGAVGEAEIVGKISEEDARKQALNNAKVEALRKAGVGENIQTYENLFRSELNNDFTEFFSSDIQTELRGAIQSYEIVSHRRKVDPVTNLFMVEVTIDASVILYKSSPDPTFNVKVEGIKAIYEEGELLTFSLQATQACYLHVFSITDNYTCLLYPNKLEKFQEIKPNQRMEFPFGNLDYELFKSGKGIDTNRMVFVFTKKPIQFLKHSGGEEQLTASETIFSWVYSIMPDERNVDYHAFTVR
ncbi:MAG: DUF4384 domain-containing protein [Tenuifilaceae bacterium]|jgi:hypothetical protein|nr:DUF4384 domain-containing protein [Tenuifilaceae bacterium]